MKLTKAEKFQIQFLLPAQGSLPTLERVQQILDKIQIESSDVNNTDEVDIDLSIDEWSFLREMIKILSQNQKLHLQSLSLIKKILM